MNLRKYVRCRCICAAACVLALLTAGLAAAGQPESASLFALPFEDALNLKVISPTKKPNNLKDSATAIYVLTGEDIRRSGATCIPEALRMVPGLNISRVRSGKWAISARGFMDQNSFKLLVLVDGRSVYIPINATVYWETQDLMLEDIDRIEVIRGPGASLWGANAVNGVINIITKKAADTQGWLATAGAGSEEKAFGSLRYGGAAGDAKFRVYAKYANRDEFKEPAYGLENTKLSGNDARDSWNALRSGFRLDWDKSASDSFTLQGDLFNEKQHEIGVYPSLAAPAYKDFVRVDNLLRGGDILGRWSHAFSADSSMSTQIYFDRIDFSTNPKGSNEANIIDVEMQHYFPIGPSNTFTWGCGYRRIWNSWEAYTTGKLQPEDEWTYTYNVFAQNEWTAIQDRLKFIVGSKFELNGYTNFEVQPTARALWTPGEAHQVWAAVSRAVRTPNRLARDLNATVEALPPNPLFPGPRGGFVRVVGDKHIASEDMNAYEIGYRIQPKPRLSFDFAAYYNRYDKLIIASSKTLEKIYFENRQGIVQLQMDNIMKGHVYGFEASADWKPRDPWRLTAGYAFARMNIYGAGPDVHPGTTPQHTFTVRSFLNLPGNFEWDVMLYYVSRTPETRIDRYLRTDMRLGWRPVKELDISLVGQNLFDNRHREAYDITQSTSSEIGRSIYAKVTWRY